MRAPRLAAGSGPIRATGQPRLTGPEGTSNSFPVQDFVPESHFFFLKLIPPAPTFGVTLVVKRNFPLALVALVNVPLQTRCPSYVLARN